ncbi:MAG: ilvE 2 [Candidatus Saccharibacteria bacterium]|nr:ilvE 2 [Candidatus Saccharibacteria bacterium]
MATPYEHAYFDGKVIAFKDANLSIASSAVLYGLSVYTVFHVSVQVGKYRAFRLEQHYNRLRSSAKIIGLDWPKGLDFASFQRDMKQLLMANKPLESVFVRATIHADGLLPGTRARGVHTQLSAFMYPATAIMKSSGVRLKTSQWRRIPDNSIPSRAKVNGAYVNSVLAHQDALDAGYDDCIFLDTLGHVCELAAANIFMVREGVLITPDTSSDLLEGINRRAILEFAEAEGIPTHERSVDLTELYIADEVFVCGTSAFVASVSEIDGRSIDGPGPITQKIAALHAKALRSGDSL